MLVKAVALFLVAMVALAVVGRLRFPRRKLPPAAGSPAPKVAAPVICFRCGTPIPGKGNCVCGAPPPANKG